MAESAGARDGADRGLGAGAAKGDAHVAREPLVDAGEHVLAPRLAHGLLLELHEADDLARLRLGPEHAQPPKAEPSREGEVDRQGGVEVEAEARHRKLIRPQSGECALAGRVGASGLAQHAQRHVALLELAVAVEAGARGNVHPLQGVAVGEADVRIEGHRDAFPARDVAKEVVAAGDRHKGRLADRPGLGVHVAPLRAADVGRGGGVAAAADLALAEKHGGEEVVRDGEGEAAGMVQTAVVAEVVPLPDVLGEEVGGVVADYAGEDTLEAVRTGHDLPLEAFPDVPAAFVAQLRVGSMGAVGAGGFQHQAEEGGEHLHGKAEGLVDEFAPLAAHTCDDGKGGSGGVAAAVGGADDEKGDVGGVGVGAEVEWPVVAVGLAGAVFGVLGKAAGQRHRSGGGGGGDVREGAKVCQGGGGPPLREVVR